MKPSSKYWYLVWLLGLMTTSLFAASDTKVQLTADNWVKVLGTSSAHDWSVKTNSIDGKIQMSSILQNELKGNGESNSAAESSFAADILIPVLSIKSEKKAMDKNMYQSLKSDVYPKIEYHAKTVSLKNVPKALSEPATLEVFGDLTIAGVTKQVTILVQLDRFSLPDQFVFSGEVSIKMTDFGIKPPVALLGMLRTGDQIKIQFRWVANVALV